MYIIPCSYQKRIHHNIVTSSSRCSHTIKVPLALRYRMDMSEGRSYARRPQSALKKRWMDQRICFYDGAPTMAFITDYSGKIVIANGWHSISIITWKIWDYCGFIMDITWKRRGFMSLPTWRVAGVFFQNLAFAVKQIRENNITTCQHGPSRCPAHILGICMCDVHLHVWLYISLTPWHFKM